MRVSAFLLVFLVPGISWGQGSGKQCKEGQPTHCVQPLETGEVAPFDGQLYTPELALEQAEAVHSFDLKLKLEIDRVQQNLEATIAGLKRLREIDAQAAAARESAHQRAMERLQPPFYERPTFIAVVTALVTAGVILSVFAIAAEYDKVLWPAPQ